MALLIGALGAPAESDGIRLERMAERHRAPLKAACAEDEAIWPIYSVSYDSDHFDDSFDRLCARPDSAPFAIFDGDTLVGMTAYLGADSLRSVVEIGNTYLRPPVRGTGFNGRLKHLMIGHAFACGIRRIEFRVDDRNTRSKAAVEKVGGLLEGVMRAERVTWTGHIRDTTLFAILQGEWRA